MRTWGRYYSGTADPVWVEVSTDPVTGDNSYVWITTLIQTLLLNLVESPFYANVGIPAYPDVIQQVFPDYYVVLVQQQFSQYFASLIITRISTETPTYQINLTTNSGVPLQVNIAK